MTLKSPTESYSPKMSRNYLFCKFLAYLSTENIIFFFLVLYVIAWCLSNAGFEYSIQIYILYTLSSIWSKPIFNLLYFIQFNLYLTFYTLYNSTYIQPLYFIQFNLCIFNLYTLYNSSYIQPLYFICTVQPIFNLYTLYS